MSNSQACYYVQNLETGEVLTQGDCEMPAKNYRVRLVGEFDARVHMIVTEEGRMHFKVLVLDFDARKWLLKEIVRIKYRYNSQVMFAMNSKLACAVASITSDGELIITVSKGNGQVQELTLKGTLGHHCTMNDHFLVITMWPIENLIFQISDEGNLIQMDVIPLNKFEGINRKAFALII